MRSDPQSTSNFNSDLRQLARLLWPFTQFTSCRGLLAARRAPMRGSARFCHRRNHHVLPAVWFMAGFSRALPSVAMRMLMVNELRVEPEQQAILGVWGEGSFKPNPNSRPQPTLSPIPAPP
jgi:hypothetical protein